MKCQRQILHIHWSQHVTNAEISARTGLPPYQKTSFICIRPHSSAHSGYSSTQRPTVPSWPIPVVYLAGTGDVVLVVLARAGQTNSATTLDLSLPTSGDRQDILRSHGGATRRPELHGYAMTTTTQAYRPIFLHGGLRHHSLPEKYFDSDRKTANNNNKDTCRAHSAVASEVRICGK